MPRTSFPFRIFPQDFFFSPKFFIPKSEGADVGAPHCHAQSIQNSKTEFCRRSQSNHHQYRYDSVRGLNHRPSHPGCGKC